MDQQPSPQALAPSQAPDPRAADVAANKDIAALSYAWVLSVFVYAYRRRSPFVRFHAKQGIALFLLSLPLLFLPPLVGRPLLLIVLIGCAMGFVSAAQGQWRELPVIRIVMRLTRMLPGKNRHAGAESNVNRSSTLTPAT